MPVSYSQIEEVVCNHCGREFDEEVWLIVDTKERTDLVEKIKEGDLHVTYCPQCGNELRMDIPLLIYNHQKQMRIIYSPQKNTSEAENQGILDSLLRVLSENLDGKFKNEWIEDVAIFPKIVLPNLLPEPEKKETKSKIALEKEDDIQIAGWEMLMIEEFTEAETLEGKYYFISNNTEFINDRIINIFEKFVEHSSKEGDQYRAGKFGQDLELLKKCQSMGIDKAFEEMIHDRSDNEEALIDPHALYEEAQQLADQYMEMPNVDLLTRQMEIYYYLFTLSAQGELPEGFNDILILVNLAVNSTERYGYTENVEDLNGAIIALEGALEGTPDDYPGYGDMLKRLGHAYGLRSNHLRRREDSELSKKNLREAEESNRK